MSSEIVLIVNGKQHTIQAAPDTPLLYVLRNDLRRIREELTPLGLGW